MHIHEHIRQYLQHQTDIRITQNIPQLVRSYSNYGIEKFNPKLYDEMKIIDKIKDGDIPDYDCILKIKEQLGKDNNFCKQLWNEYKKQIKIKSISKL